MPQDLHSELARAADGEGVSLNHFITVALGRAVGWKTGSSDLAHRSSPTRPHGPAGKGWPASTHRQPGLVTLALAANLIVVALAGVAAIVLLVLAWRHGW